MFLYSAFQTCNRCYVKTSSKFPHCPTCQEKTTFCDPNSDPNAIANPAQFLHTKDLAKLSTKPEIIVLDACSITKNSVSFENNMEGVIENATEDIHLDTADNLKDEKPEVFITEQMDFTVDEN